MATQTANYHFPKYEADDLPNLLDEYNEFADLADAAINNAMMTATNAGTAAQNASTKADAASTKVDGLEDTVDTLSAQVTTAQNTAEQALSLAQTNESGITELDTHMGTANQAITALQTGKAPTSHASSTTQYGSATATNYGHVRLSDVAAATPATSGVAATPKAVNDALAAALERQVLHTETLNFNAGGVTANLDFSIVAIGDFLVAVSCVAQEGGATSTGMANVSQAISWTLPEQYRPSRDLEGTMSSYVSGSTGFIGTSAIRVKASGEIEAVFHFSQRAESFGVNGNFPFIPVGKA